MAERKPRVMKLYSAADIRNWDQFTIENEPIRSIDLMERAATRCVEWLERNFFTDKQFHIFCGKGNNGGDGLAIARLLSGQQLPVTVHILEFGHKGTADFQTNLARLHQQATADIRYIQTEENFPGLTSADLVIDALFGSGLNRGLEGVTADLVRHLNASPAPIISIDIPSGMFCDTSSRQATVIKADHTLTFQCYKLAMLMPENSPFTGNVHVLDIGLHPGFVQTVESNLELIDTALINTLFKSRNQFGHKGTYGHALIVAGSYGKIGAAVLCTKACLRSGAGLVTCHLPACGYEIMQTSLPEAMVSTDFNSSFNTGIVDDLSKYDALGVGPGIGTASETRTMLNELLQQYDRPLVLDADALNIIASKKEMLQSIPPQSILTPHPKEFERLFDATANDFERIQLAMEQARLLDIIIVLKGHHTAIITPGGKTFFNSTGNAGMATAGSGDVLTGILTGLLCQRYRPEEAAVLGVFLHGRAGDLAAAAWSQEAMIAGDITDYLGQAFQSIATS